MPLFSKDGRLGINARRGERAWSGWVGLYGRSPDCVDQGEGWGKLSITYQPGPLFIIPAYFIILSEAKDLVIPQQIVLLS